MLFSSNFHSKVLNAVALTNNHLDGTFSVWTKSPCPSVAVKLTNVVTQSTGFRQGYIALKLIFEMATTYNPV